MDIPHPATVIANLVSEVDIPKDGTLSRVLFKDDNLRLVLFAFDTDQELTEHTASMPAIAQVISGRARLDLGEETVTAVPGSWIHMPAHLPHSVLALEPTVLLLTLIRK
ncbi:MAG: cupin domain-containing protein [Acidimicrobiia bacterium]|nr:cupin domain-containing protein [Acidimicrobiia bacterium]